MQGRVQAELLKMQVSGCKLKTGQVMQVEIMKACNRPVGMGGPGVTHEIYMEFSLQC